MIDERPETKEIPTETPIRVRAIALDEASFSSRVIFRWIAITILVLFAAVTLGYIISSLRLLLFFVVLSVFLAYLIDPLVKLIRRPFKSRHLERFMPRPLAIVIAFAIVLSVVGLAVSYIAPRAVEQAKDFGASLPTYATSLRQAINDMNRRFDRLRVPEEVQTRINDQLVAIGQQITTIAGGFLLSLLIYLPWLVIVPILTFFMLKDGELIRISTLRMFPPGRWRERAGLVLSDISNTLAAYTRAMLVSSVFIGTICSIGFSIIGMRYALLLGILAGIFEFVPLLGPLTIGIISTAVAALGSDPQRGIWVAIFLIVLRIFHDYVSYPRIVRGGLHLHPLLIILSILAGEQIAGITGVFLAIPVVAIFTVMYKHVLEHQGRRTLLDGLRTPETVAAELVEDDER
ncbi:MAG: AI-2E family transporter [Acidobacteria bacterium]|nr:AI-2E family transporter [Acidobacteriota bacterium]